MSNNISKIIYINSDKRIENRQLIENELDSFQLNYERFSALHVPGFGGVKFGGILGFGLAHFEVIKLAKERDYENVLILEDDFTFDVTKEEFEQQLSDFFNLNLDYDVCMLSYDILESEPTSHSLVRKVLENKTATGYIVNKKYFDKMIQIYSWAVEQLKRSSMGKIFGSHELWKQFQKTDNWYYFTKMVGKKRISE